MGKTREITLGELIFWRIFLHLEPLCGTGVDGALGCMDISVAHPHTFAHPHLHDDVHYILAIFGLFRPKNTPKKLVKCQDFEIPWILRPNLILFA